MPTLYWFMSIVNANFSVNPMSHIINFCRWKLVKHLNCFRDNRRTKDARKIICSAVLKHVVWLYSDTAFLITFLHEKVGMKSLKRILRNLDGQNKPGAPKGKHVRNWKKAKKSEKGHIFVSSQICRMSGNLQISVSAWSRIDTYRCGTKCNVSTKFFFFWKRKLTWKNYAITKID